MVDKPNDRHEEYQYLDLVRNVMQSGNDKNDRTGTGTLSLFGTTMRFSLRNDQFPLLTTKKVFFRGIAEELLWMISGDTSVKTLQDKNVHIWDANGCRDALDKLGFPARAEGDLGPVYGFQWRHFGAKYVNMTTDYKGQGVDQLQQVIDTLRKDPNSRRIVMTAWNPSDLSLMALPPCHMFCQFYVANGELSCLMYQRSCDLGLGVPFNIASYALLTRLIAQATNLKAGEFIHHMGDTHVYKNHVGPLEMQLKRTPKPFPTLRINPLVTDIDKFTFDHFQIVGYDPHPAIKMEMSA